jgi:hypothetical protein
MQDDRVGLIVPGKVGDVDVRKRDREQLEPGLLHEELNQCTLQGDRDGDEDPQCWVRSSCQTRVLGSHIRSVVAHRRPRGEKLAAQPPGGRAFTVARPRSKSDTSTAGHGWVTWEAPARPIWTISKRDVSFGGNFTPAIRGTPGRRSIPRDRPDVRSVGACLLLRPAGASASRHVRRPATVRSVRLPPSTAR